MLQRYKLRLGDGTILTVDRDGLVEWQADARAAVQVAGTQQWRPVREVLAEEDSAARLARALVPPKPREEAAAPPVAAEPPATPALLPPSSWPDDPSTLSIGTDPKLQVLADDPATLPAGRETLRAKVEPEAPVIRLKPLDDEPAPARTVSPAWAPEEDEGELEDEPSRQGRLDGPLLTVLATLGAFLSRCLDPLTPLVSGRSPASPDEAWPDDDDAPARSVPPRPAPALVARDVQVLAEDPARERRRPSEDESPIIRLRPPDEDAPSPGTRPLVAWFEALKERVAGLTRWARPEPAPRGEEARPAPAPPAPAPPKAKAPPLRESLKPPTPVSELPSLRLAPLQEPSETGDLYEGEVSGGGGSLATVWRWTVRVAVVGAIVAGGAYAALNWETWFPRAAELGQTVFTEIDRQARSRERTEQQERTLEAAVAQLPQLAPETIRLVLSASPDGVLDPPEVFQLAVEAADRGRTALAPAEAAELEALRRELLGTLRPLERERVREYDNARARRLIFSFENPRVMELFARGARALPSPDLERLRALLGKAVAAGLAPPPGSPDTPAR